ncbi:MAG: Holliday junction resolvase RuvX [Candidatus Promineifilaceae bacterium]
MGFGRLLAIDLGEKRIGIALSDAMQIVSKPLHIFQRTSRKADFAHYQQLINEHDVVLVVMGLPTYLNGDDSTQTKWVRHYSAELAENISVPLVFQNEAYSTKNAHKRMNELGYNQKKQDQQRDAVAAALFLQEYLDDHGGL